MHERTAKRLHDALTAAHYIRSFVDGRTFQEYLNDAYFRSAVERQFEVLAEALKAAVSRNPELLHTFPEMHAIVGLRNRIAHSYDELDEKTLWDAATVEIPILLPRIAQLLEHSSLADE